MKRTAIIALFSVILLTSSGLGESPGLGDVGIRTSTGEEITCGNYMAFYSISGNLIGEGSLRTDGSFPTLLAIPNKKAHIIITPCDFKTTHKITRYDFVTRTEPTNLDILIKTCDEAKNTLSITLQRRKASGIYEFPLPNSVSVTTPSGKIINLVSGVDYIPGVDDIVVHDGFEIGTHTVKIVRKDSTIITDTKPVTFDTDCFSSKHLIFDAEPIANTADIIIKVVRTDDKTPVQGVYVYVDTDTTGYLSQKLMTDNVGMIDTIYSLPYADHTFTLKRTGFKDITHTLTVNSSTSAIQTLEITNEKPTSSSEKPLSTPGFRAIQSILLFAIVVSLLRKKN